MTISPSDSPKSVSETTDRLDLPISVRLLHEQADRMFPGEINEAFRKQLKATSSNYEFYRCISERSRTR